MKESKELTEETETSSEVVVESAEEDQGQTDEMVWNIAGEQSGEVEPEKEAQKQPEETEDAKATGEAEPEEEVWQEKDAGETGQKMGE